jgi:hypothetical protein
MNASRGISFVALAALAVALLFGGGCAYLADRGRDLTDLVEPGITVTPRLAPTVALRVNAFGVVSFGYSRSDLTLLGWSDRQFGALRLRDDFWGVLAWGEERIWVGRDAAASWPEGCEPPATSLPFEGREPYTVGMLGSFLGEERPPSRVFGECPKLFHLGWLGLYTNCSPLDLADFILGWSTLDIGCDDVGAG